MEAAPALRLDLKPSRFLASALILAHGLALSAVWISLVGWARYLACAAILASLGSTLTQALLRAGRRALSLELREDGRASWRNSEGTWHEAKVGSRHFVSGVLAILELESTGPGRRKWLLLMSDSVPPGEFRRLRVWLRWRRSPSQARPE
jgi:toxin CptA